VSLLEIDNIILQIRNELLTLPRADPRRSMYFATLALVQLARYWQTDENEDLEESISLSVEAILLFDPNIGHGSDVVEAFFSLADSLFRRLQKLNRPDDSKHCLRYFRYLRDQSLSTSHITTDVFTYALANQVQMESIDPTRNIEEVAILCCELLSLDAPDRLVFSAIAALVDAIYDEPVSRLPPDQAIECLREANIRFPDSESVSLSLLYSLLPRFMVTRSNADYEDAMSIVDGSFTHPGFVKVASSVAVELAQFRFHLYGHPEYLEEAIYRIRVYHRTLSSEDLEHQKMTLMLENLEKARLDEFSVASSSQAVDASNTEVKNRPSSSRVVPPLPIARPDIGELTPMTQDTYVLDVLKTFLRLSYQPINRATIKEAMECRWHYLESPQPSDFVTSAINVRFAQILIEAFRCTDDMAHLNESITLLRDVLKGPVTPFTRLRIIRQLISALSSRFMRFCQTVDNEEIMQLFSIAAADTCAKIPDRFRISCQWVEVAWGCGHPSTSTAYESAISLMKDSLAFSPTLETQHSCLVSSLDNYDTLPLDYASHQIDKGQLEQAVETLERGRGLLWSEMRGLRMSTDQLRIVNLPLAERFAAINNNLETLTTSSSAGIWPNEGHANSDEPMDLFGRLVVKQRALVAERDKLISQIQSLPGFGTFLMTPSFDTVRSAAEHGPVIIINHTRWRSDILILLHDAPTSLIPTPDNFYECANQLKDQLLGARNHGLDSGAYDDALSSVLETLYDLVGRPVSRDSTT